MSRYRLELANEADDADLRAVLAATPMPGRIALTFRREPSFFASIRQEAEFVQVIACRDLETGRVVGFGCRAVNTCYVNGEPTPVGYLSSLRLLQEHRSLGLIARGYKMLRDLHEDGRTAFYLTTIADGNDVATKVLTSGRAGLPVYEPFGRYVTLVLAAKRTFIRYRLTRYIFERFPHFHQYRMAEPVDAASVKSFLQQHGPGRQFFPCHDPPAAGSWFAHGDPIGCSLGLWDQSPARQTVVTSYDGWLHFVRPLINAWAFLCNRMLLPRPGGKVDYLTVVGPTCVDGSPHSFLPLLDGVVHSMPSGRFLMFGLHERDPLLAVVRQYAVAEYVTHLYLVHWGDGPRLDDRPPYLELGCL